MICPICKSKCYESKLRIQCNSCCYRLYGQGIFESHRKITNAVALWDDLKWLKEHELSLGFKQDSQGNCTVYSEDSGYFIEDKTPSVLKLAKESLKEVTTNIFDVWG